MGENTQNKKIAIIIMASGYSERFGSNKLLESFLDKPLFTYTVDLVASCQAEMKIIATRYEPVIQYVKGECSFDEYRMERTSRAGDF